MTKLSILLTLLLSTQLLAGLEVGVSVGYGFPAGGHLEVLEGVESNAAGNQYSSVNHGYVSLGNGVKVDVEACYYLAENYGIMAATGVSFLGGYYTEETRITDGGTTYLQTEDFSSGYVPLNIGLRFRARASDLEPFVYFAPGLYFPINVTRRSENNNDIDSADLRFDVGVGFSSAAGFQYRIRSDLMLRAELNATYAYATLNESWNTNTNKTSRVVITEIERFENDTPGVHGKELLSFGSVGLKVGVVKSF